MSTPAKTKNMALRGPLVHLAIVGVSVAVAAVLWTRDDEPTITAATEVTVWGGSPTDVQRIVYESKTKKVVLDAKKDAQGMYLVGVVDMESPVIVAPPDAGAPAASAKAGAVPAPSASAIAGAPSASAKAGAVPAPSASAVAGAPSASAKAGAVPAPSASAIAGAPSASAKAGAAPAPSASAIAGAAPPAPSASAGAGPAAPTGRSLGATAPPGRAVINFVSVTAGNKLIDALAPFKAIRSLGKVADADAAEFGLAQPDASVVIKLSSGEKRLFLGSITPGGGDRYVKEAGSAEVFVVRGEPFRFLDAPESWMIEREMHGWKEIDAKNVKLTAGDKTRKLVHGGPEGKKFWADPATPDVNDDALNNWMSKLFRLRPLEYVLELPPGGEPILRAEFSGEGATGFVELIRFPPSSDGPEYLMRTERTRLYGRVHGLFTEQLEQDIGVAIK
jgi:hypothetical protein